MGYYSRARNLHKAARMLVNDHDGKVPDDPHALKALPGIGPYTLAAVLSLAFDRPHAVLDGNVERVLTRLTAWDADIRKPTVKAHLRTLAGRLLNHHPPGAFNEAMMELGATVCLPKRPDCGTCPLREICRGRRTGHPEQFPFKSPRKPIPTLQVGAGVVWRDSETFLIARRKEEGMLGGLWEFPGGKLEQGEAMAGCIRRELREELDIEVDVGEHLTHVRHTYSHFHLRMDVHHCRWRGDPPQALDCADFRWVTLAECDALPFSKADLKVIQALKP
jgi:A/G-specific adenine glycosylase